MKRYLLILPLLFFGVLFSGSGELKAQSGKNEFAIFKAFIVHIKNREKTCTLTFVDGKGEKEEKEVDYEEAYFEYLKWLNELTDEGWEVEEFIRESPSSTNAYDRLTVLLHRKKE